MPVDERVRERLLETARAEPERAPSTTEVVRAKRRLNRWALVGCVVVAAIGVLVIAFAGFEGRVAVDPGYVNPLVPVGEEEDDDENTGDEQGRVRPRPAVVPSVVGERAGAAFGLVESRGLKPKLQGPCGADVQACLVVAQRPDPEQRRPRGSTVVLTVELRSKPPPGGGGKPPAAERVTVPKVEDMRPAEAEERLDAAGLGARIVGDCPDAATCTVRTQHPKARRRVAPKTEVRLRIASDDAPLPEVPDLVGDDEADAVAELETAGYNVERRTPCEAEQGCRVSEQDPPGGRELAAGETVTITLEPLPDDGVEVPRVERLPLDEALARLEEAGLEADYDRSSDGTHVSSQDPKEGEKVDKGSAVTLELGPPPGSDGEP